MISSCASTPGSPIPGVPMASSCSPDPVLLLGLGLLANGIVRIVDGFRNKDIYETSAVYFRIGAGIVSAAIAILVLVYPVFGFVLILLILSIALLITGIELIIVGIKGRRNR